MSSQEFQRISGAQAALSERVARLEAGVAALQARLSKDPGAPIMPGRTYTVRPGDTLSAIAAGLGIGDWRALYEANRSVIGPNPDLIRPGQVLSVPR